MVALLLLVGCEGPPDPDPTGSPATEPADPGGHQTAVPGAPASPTPVAEAPAATPTAPPPPAGAVLLHLDGDPGDPETTGLVVRTDDGEAFDRFAFPGGESTLASAGTPWALVGARDDRWALYDGAARTLTLLAEPTPGAGVDVLLRGPAVVWPVEQPTHLLRLDDRTVTDLVALVGEEPTAVRLSDDGQRAVLSGDRAHLLTTDPPTVVRRLDVPDVAVDPAMTRVATLVTSPVEGVDLVVTTFDGTAATLWANLPAAGPLAFTPDGRVLVGGSTPRLVAADGQVVDVAAPAPLRPPVRPLGSGRALVGLADGGWAVLDLATAQASAIDGSRGAVPLDHPAGTAVWARGADDPRRVVVLTAAGELQELTTQGGGEVVVAPDATSAVVALQTPRAGGDADAAALVVGADGAVRATVAGQLLLGAAYDPTGDRLALAVLAADGTAELRLGPAAGPLRPVGQGTRPVWVTTEEAAE